MSKWGNEESQTLAVINSFDNLGNVLNVAAGDGRFINELLKRSNRLTAIDIDENELELLKSSCKEEYLNKLTLQKVDIRNKFPYNNETYDTIFCTGTLHLFNKDAISFIINEMTRCLKLCGILIMDFATDIKRLDENDNKVVFDNECGYTLEEATTLFKELLNDYLLDINKYTFYETNLKDAGYSSIEGNFIVIIGKKTR